MASIALKAVHPNMIAFLLMIQQSEGVYKFAVPYGTLVGGGQFRDFSKHPNKLVKVNNEGLYSTAAGAYQFLNKTWQGVAAKLNLKDFTPESQDKAAIELIKQRGAYDDVIEGNIKDAIYKCRKEWASLPGANYPGQGMRSLQSLLMFYAYILPLSTAILPAAELAAFAVKKKELSSLVQ